MTPSPTQEADQTFGLRCPRCGSLMKGDGRKVIETRHAPHNTLRRRIVCKCGLRITTRESVVKMKDLGSELTEMISTY